MCNNDISDLYRIEKFKYFFKKEVPMPVAYVIKHLKIITRLIIYKSNIFYV